MSNARSLSLASLLTLSAACTVVQQKAAPSGSSPGDAGSAAAPHLLSCLQIFQCAGNCADSDAPCPDACLASGTADAQSQASTLADCIQKQSCTDAACVQSKCATSLDGCVKGSAPTPAGAPLAGAPPTGSVPPDLVGTWAHDEVSNYSLVLNADGTGSWGIALEYTLAGCAVIESSLESGNAVVTGDMITLYASNVSNLSKQCSSPEKRTVGDPLTETFTWTRADTATDQVLVVTDLRCVPPGGDPVTYNCVHQLVKTQ